MDVVNAVYGGKFTNKKKSNYQRKDLIMTIDLYVKSQQLLEVLANSIHDREPKTLNPFFFSITEIQAAERWLYELVRELKNTDIDL